MPWDTALVEKQSDPPTGALTRAFLGLYLGFAALSAAMLLWLLLRVLSYQFAGLHFVVPSPPITFLVAPIVLMMVTKIAAAWGSRRDARSSRR